MARQLWLLRHAEAEPHGVRPDSERRLTERGEQQARAAGLALGKMEISFHAVLFSPKARARQTAELVAEGWSAEADRLDEYPALAGAFDARQAAEALASVGPEARVLMIGHEPDLSRVVTELTGGGIDLKKGGLAVVRLEGGTSGELVVLMRPREMGLIAGVPSGGH